MNENLQLSREDRVLRITLNRPGKRNALTPDMCRELVEAVDDAQNDTAIGAILIDSKGDVFCAGMDLDGPQADATAIHERLFTMGARARKPIAAAIQGPALGGGVGLICNTHVAIAAHGSSFGLTEIRVGMWPFVIYRSVVAALGDRRTLELSLTGRIFNLPEALQWGLIHEAVPAFELEDRATAVATNLSHSSQLTMSLGLELAQRTFGMDPVSAAPIALELRKKAFNSADFQEGIAAFREKRRPNFNR